MIKTHFSGNHPVNREQALCQIGVSIQPVEFLPVRGVGGGNVPGGTAGKNCPSGKICSCREGGRVKGRIPLTPFTSAFVYLRNPPIAIPYMV